jgi:capsular polysaccharide biosynthesis protein
VMTVDARRRAHQHYDGAERLLSFGEIWQVLVHHLWIIACVTLALVGLAVGFSLAQTPTYEASTRILVGERQQDGSGYSLAADVQGLQQLTTTLAEAVDSRPVAEGVVKQSKAGLAPEKILTNLQAQQVPNTLFIQVTYRDSDPKRARLVANTTAQVFAREMDKISPNAYGAKATVWESAEVPQDPVSPDLKINVLLALAVAAFLGPASAFLVAYAGGWFKNWDVEETQELRR